MVQNLPHLVLIQALVASFLPPYAHAHDHGHSYGASDPHDHAVGEVSDDAHSHSNSEFGLIQLHGAIMILAFVVLYPAGAVALRKGPKSQAFTWHILFQISASFLALVGAIVAGVSIRHDVSGHLKEPHVVIGIILVILVGLQILLGWNHHRGYKRKMPTPISTLGHTSSGRVLVIGGCINMFLGLDLMGASSSSRAIGGLATAFDLVIVAWLIYIRNKKVATRESVSGEENEDSAPFLAK